MESFYCYECGRYHETSNMQDYDCTICGGRKCRALHGGDLRHSCYLCGHANLCSDCFSLRRCCDSSPEERDRIRHVVSLAKDGMLYSSSGSQFSN